MFYTKNNLRLFAQICPDYQLMYLCIVESWKQHLDDAFFDILTQLTLR